MMMTTQFFSKHTTVQIQAFTQTLYESREGIRVSQIVSLNPGRQEHEKLLVRSAHDPPFRQGLELHSLTSENIIQVILFMHRIGFQYSSL